ncbi:MAG: carbohydrate ABC transporter permease [Armatimonadota bacterium]
MPLISKIGRRSAPAVLAFSLMYLVLIIGGITMVVPFLVMLANSFKSNVDKQDYFDLFPKYWTDRRMLTLKYLEQQTNYDLNFFNEVARANEPKLEDFNPPAEGASAVEVADYREFVKALPPTYTELVNRGPEQDLLAAQYGTHPALIDYRNYLMAPEKYGSLAGVMDKYNAIYADQEQLLPPVETWFNRAYQPEANLRLRDFLDFKAQQPVDRIMPIPAESIWNRYLRLKFGIKPTDVNPKLGTNYASVDTAPLSLQKPAGSKELVAAWEDCVRNDMPIWFVRADESARPIWKEFLKKRFQNNFALYRKAHPETTYTSFEQIPLPAETPLYDGVAMGEWSDFITKTIPADSIRLDTPEQRYREFLLKKYRTVTAVNQAYGTDYQDVAGIYLPSLRVMVTEVQTNGKAIRGEFTIRNYRTVFNYLLLHGRAFFNTAVYIILALLFTLTVNPVTAYALSRFKLKATNKVLLFLLATMAFPAEIAMIPNFLILKELHLLNTFWALVLPGMANGFNIFLLKGMFDGLPQDLYEAASLDGASELTIFWRVTMPLVKPFLAYLALGTFVACYSAFAFAFILCPDPKMWTIMVFLQQMGNWASQPVMFAAFVLASIPTLIVFVTCQRIIMRGIVLPTEK